MLLLELDGTVIALCRMKSAGVVDFVDKVRRGERVGVVHRADLSLRDGRNGTGCGDVMLYRVQPPASEAGRLRPPT